ncbi:MAG: RNA methyltransferase [Proteobacteria bacterium]|nr:RNA methyltransferase [Pseudomonadota bacterium]
MKSIAALLGCGVALAVGVAFAFSNPVAWGEAALLMWDVAAGGEHTYWQEVTPPPTMYPTRWQDEHGTGEGDLYTPGDKVRAAVVLVPGAAALGRAEPRLQALARSLARAGFVVLVPDLAEVRQFRLSRADADSVASALRELRRWQPDRPLGAIAVSYAVAPTIIAALQDDLAATVDFIVGIGGYRDTETVIRFMTTGVFRPVGSAREMRLSPNFYGRWTFLLANANRIDDEADARRLLQIAGAHLGRPDADTSALAVGLGPQGRAILALVENRDPDAVGRLIADLPAAIRHEIDGLDLALYDLSKLRCHLILVHGRDDRMVPYSESQNLAAAASNARVSLFLVDGIGHVEFEGVTAANGWTMGRAVLSLLNERRD